MTGDEMCPWCCHPLWRYNRPLGKPYGIGLGSRRVHRECKASAVAYLGQLADHLRDWGCTVTAPWEIEPTHVETFRDILRSAKEDQ